MKNSNYNMNIIKDGPIFLSMGFFPRHPLDLLLNLLDIRNFIKEPT